MRATLTLASSSLLVLVAGCTTPTTSTGSEAVSPRPVPPAYLLEGALHTSARPTVPISTQRPAPPTYLGAIATVTSTADGSLLLSPPGNRRPALSATEAYRDFCRTHAGSCAQPGSAGIVLALLTSTNGEPSVTDVLSYVLTWRAVECPRTGPDGEPPLPPMACDQVDPVDADTGHGIVAEYLVSSRP